jgi:hypothetical protein
MVMVGLGVVGMVGLPVRRKVLLLMLLLLGLWLWLWLWLWLLLLLLLFVLLLLLMLLLTLNPYAVLLILVGCLLSGRCCCGKL